MRKQVLVALTMAATFFGACAQTGKTSRTKTRTHGQGPELSAVSMRRGACFGRCPEYTLSVKSDGTVTYIGTRNTPTPGTYQKNIGAEAAGSILGEFREFRVDTLRSNYDANISDLPGLGFTFTLNGQEKRVGNANFGPPFLINLSERLDSYGQVDKSWKKLPDAAAE